MPKSPHCNVAVSGYQVEAFIEGLREMPDGEDQGEPEQHEQQDD
jgi:hypothetical protein